MSTHSYSRLCTPDVARRMIANRYWIREQRYVGEVLDAG